MIEENSLRFEENIAKILNRSVDLFKSCGLEELSEKWDKILKNYVEAKKLR